MHDFASLPQTIQSDIANYPLDILTTTHRCCTWAEQLPDASFVRLRGYTVLLPLAASCQANIAAKHIFLEANDPAIVFLLQAFDSHATDNKPTTVIAICPRVRNQQFYVATVYHHINHTIGFDSWLYKGVKP